MTTAVVVVVGMTAPPITPTPPHHEYRTQASPRQQPHVSTHVPGTHPLCVSDSRVKARSTHVVHCCKSAARTADTAASKSCVVCATLPQCSASSDAGSLPALFAWERGGGDSMLFSTRRSSDTATSTCPCCATVSAACAFTPGACATRGSSDACANTAVAREMSPL